MTKEKFVVFCRTREGWEHDFADTIREGARIALAKRTQKREVVGPIRLSDQCCMGALRDMLEFF